MSPRLESLVTRRRNQFSCRASRCAAAVTVVLACAAIAGCSSEPEHTPVFKTTGKVVFQNAPVAGAFLVLHPKGPVNPEDPKPNAYVKEDGTFATTTFVNADGAPAGDYVVTIEHRKLIKYEGDWQPGPNILPSKYESPTTSDIVIHVAEGENTLPEIVLR